MILFYANVSARGKVSHQAVRGFSMVELVVVLGIVLLVLMASVPNFSPPAASSDLNETVTQSTQTIRTAQVRARAHQNGRSHGVYFETIADAPDRYVLYQGSSYAARDEEYDRVIELSPAITVSSTFSGNDISFSKGRAMPSATGTVTFTHTTEGSRSITVNEIGLVEEK